MLNDISSSLPGIDEAMGFAELMRQVSSMNYSCIIFDTAPTGHTLRLIGFPAMLENAMSKLSSIQDRMSPLFSTVFIIIFSWVHLEVVQWIQ